MILKKIKIKDIGDIITGKTPLTKVKEYYGDDYVFIKPTYIDMNSRYFENIVEKVSEEAFKKYENSFVPKNSTCVVTIGSIGEKICLTKELCMTNQAINTVVPNLEKYDPIFIYYLLKYNLYKVKSMNNGTSSGRENVSKGTFENIEVEVPELQTQKKIAKILSAYDDLIENNLTRIKLLEESADLLYKEWFVNFRFSGYEKYKETNFEQKSISELIEYSIGGGWGKDEREGNYIQKAYVIRGTDIDDILIGDIQNIPYRYHTEKNIEKRLLKQGDIVLEVSNGQINNIGRSLLYSKELGELLNDKTICASFCKLLRPNEEGIINILFLHIRYIKAIEKIKFYINTSAAGINNFRFNDFLEQEKISILPTEVIDKFNRNINQILTMREKLNIENSRLKEARDILIPKLITGEIEV